MEKPKIKVFERKREFYSDDLKSIDEKEGDWGELEILEDLTYDETEIGSPDFPDCLVGCLVCWNKKEKQIEILQYKY